MGGMLRKSLSILLDLLVPPRCHDCGRPLWDCAQPFLCPDCLGNMPWIGSGACPRCGYPAGPFASWGAGGCARCAGRRLELAGVAAVSRYAAGAKGLVRALKFHGERRLAPAMGELMAARWLAAGLTEQGTAEADARAARRGRVDLVAPVSLHPRRRRARGFDQSALLAETVARRLGLEWNAGAVIRLRATRPQSLLRRRQRLAAMEGVFAAGASVRGRTVLLVDDVLTTGTTMSAAAAACKRAGAKKVYGLTFAR